MEADHYSMPARGFNICVKRCAEVKETKTVGPVLIHVITDKGRGYDPSLKAADRMHGVTKFDPRTGTQVKGKSTVSAPGICSEMVCSTGCRHCHVIPKRQRVLRTSRQQPDHESNQG